jgi:hypothetical protein
MKKSETPIMDDKAVGLPDSKDVYEDALQAGGLISFLEERFSRAEDARRFDEERWLRAYRNYRGIYGPDVQFTEAEKSRVFIKVTKTKTLAAYGQITDVLFANNTFPLSIEPTILPEGVAESVHVEADPKMAELWRRRANRHSLATKVMVKTFLKGPLLATLADMLGPLKEKLAELDVKAGAGVTPTSVTFPPSNDCCEEDAEEDHGPA